MVDPLTALSIGSAGVGLARSIFGNKRKFKYPKMDPFSFTPNENDPELNLLRRGALEETSRSRSRDVNEISRAGLLGSGAAFGILGESENRGSRQLEDIYSSVFSRRRSEALDQYNRELDFRRQIAIQELGGDINSESYSSRAGFDSLGDIGSFLGGKLDNDDDIDSLIDFLMKRKRGIKDEGQRDYTNMKYPESRG